MDGLYIYVVASVVRMAIFLCLSIFMMLEWLSDIDSAGGVSQAGSFLKGIYKRTDGRRYSTSKARF